MEVPIPTENEADFIALMRIVIDHIDMNMLSFGQREVASALLTYVESCDIKKGEVVTEECDIDF